MELLTYYLGLEVKQTAKYITLKQTSYAKKIVEKVRLDEGYSCAIPLDSIKYLDKDEEPYLNPTEYRRPVGKLRYLVNTRPDITHAIGMVSQHLEATTTEHFQAIKQILRYVKRKINLGLSIDTQKKLKPS